MGEKDGKNKRRRIDTPPQEEQTPCKICTGYCIVLFACILAYILYVTSMNMKSVHQLIKNKISVFGKVFFSLFLIMGVIFYIDRDRSKRLHKISRYVIVVLSLFLMFIWDQKNGDKGIFGYGYWASRTYLIIIVFACILVVLYRILDYVCKKTGMRKSMIFCVCAYLLLLVAFRLLFLYSIRKRTFDEGLFGEHFKPELTNCRLDNDIFLMSRLIPKHIFHMVLLTYWCRKDRHFVKIIDDPSEPHKTKIKIYGITGRTACDIHLFPNLNDFYSYQELRNFEEDDPNWTVTNLQHHLLQKIVTVRNIDKREYSYDGTIYETTLVECGTERNLVVSPKRKFDHNPRRVLKDVSLTTPNVILLWFDCESRKLFEHDFPETIEWMRKEIYESKDYDFFQFYSHHIVGWNTYPQFLAMFNGDRETKNFSHPLWEMARLQGYLTIYSDDECNDAPSRYNKNPNGKLNMFDYTHLEPFCLRDYTDIDTHFNGFYGALAVARRCLVQYEAPQYIFEYFKKIEKIYPEKAKLFYAMFDEAHEGSGESIRYIDRYLKDYFIFLKESGALEKSIIYMFADHGNHASVVLNMFNEGKLGKRNPMLYMISPKDYLKEDQRKNLNTNQHRLVTSLDLHVTWNKILGDRKEGLVLNKYGIDLINDEVPFDRSCKSAGIPQGNCDSLVCGK